MSAATRSAWAKSEERQGSSLSLVQHSLDAAAVGALVWDRWLPTATRRVLAEALPGGEVDGRILLSWLAGVHDVGKLTPAFACQVWPLAERMDRSGLPLKYPVANRRDLPHNLASQVVLEQFLVDECGWAVEVAATFATVAGSHHGVPPGSEAVMARYATSKLGSGAWVTSRSELLWYMACAVGAAERFPDWRGTPLPVGVQMLLTAAVIVADWLASNDSLFPLVEGRDPLTADRVWKDLGLPAPWQPHCDVGEADLLSKRFKLPPGATAHPLQLEVVRLAARVSEPGLMIIEAPMGEGKTEAALLAAEILARRFGFGGVFVALPTMATSDAMFGRVLEWAGRLPDPAGSVFLAHGKAALNDAFVRLGQGHLDAIGIDCAEDAVVVHEWLAGRKKGPLSNFVVGTIDQVLTAALKVRHVMLRHLALANKVVVIDEVHAADSYMSTYLARCLEWLGAYQVPVLLLSATLPPAQRNTLIDAYRRGASKGSAQPVEIDSSYPCLTVCSAVDVRTVAVEPSDRSLRVSLDRLEDDPDVVVEKLRDLLTEGGCVGIVCNTVARAQAMFTALRAKQFGKRVFADSQLMLLHSRFIAADRTRLEARLRKLLGPPGKGKRPTRLIVVATQVVEQSLDIDFDLLITDLAPVDLILQRMGRLHRHDRPRRPARVAAPICLIRGVVGGANLPPLVQGSVAVYGASRLLRAAAVLDEHFAGKLVTLPGDVPTLVADAYAQKLAAPESWEEAIAQADERWAAYIQDQVARARDYLLPSVVDRVSLSGILDAPARDADGAGGQAQVRDTDESVEAIVVQRAGSRIRMLPNIADFGADPIPTDRAPSAAMAKALAGCTIRLPNSLTNYGRISRVETELEQNRPRGWRYSPWLRNELALVLDEQFQAKVAGRRLHYDPLLGLTVTSESGPE
nr:CRISPR-associated helicase Cas3' [Nocardia brasiliensis]